ncbi:MAG: hypothetical protein DSY89_10590 [Deltaproteobacteria bacterium]|nr:MAG: hypothetical protein DSY89_10590 [Deltaproteobacteria bacterium]
MPKKNSAGATSCSELTGYGRDIMKFRVSSGVKGRIRVLSPETKSTGRACRRHPVRGMAEAGPIHKCFPARRPLHASANINHSSACEIIICLSSR